MSLLSPFLKKANSVREVPLDAYILYNLDGGVFWIDSKNYPSFVYQWIGLSNPPPLTLDLSSARVHSIILDIDYQSSATGSPKFILKLIDSVLKTTLLPSVPNFTYLVTFRLGGKGFHIHLPEFKIGNDDYVHFCEMLQLKFEQAMTENERYKLDILTNAMLPGAAKPNCNPYVPLAMVYMDERNTFNVELLNLNEDKIKSWKKCFVKRKDNEHSVFRNFMLNCSPELANIELKHLMMPVIVNSNPAKTYPLVYSTTIGKYCNTAQDWQEVATFIDVRSKQMGFVSKCKNFSCKNSSNYLKTYTYMKMNTRNMDRFETWNHALKTWFKRFKIENSTRLCDVPEFFADVHAMLQYEHTTLAENPNTIKTIMQFKEGYYFLPIFYALCRHYKLDSRAMAEKLHSVLDKPFHALLGKIQSVNPKNIQFAMTDISINTLHFCANNLHEERPDLFRDELKLIVENNKRAILSITTHDQIVDLIRSIQERHLPILVLKLKNGLKKPSRYVWNSIGETWQEVSGEIPDHMNNLWNRMKQCVNDHRASGGEGGPDDDLMNKFSVVTVISAIMSDTSMERKDIQMDAHKWFLRIEDGLLDLLTGHVGGVVPEFFLSDRKIGIGIPRREMMALVSRDSRTKKYVDLYDLLTDEKFFLRYVKNLFLDTTDNLFDTLRNAIVSADPMDDDLCVSMLHFYINLCKCTSFEYDMLMYMMDILASVYIGTNYERKFFVWKGLTRNGKSKLFELMSSVLGGYYHSIQSENLAPGHSSNNATPELASTLFACRMVTSEELDKKINENRVKQITGNSFVTFRNMYEQNSGGIPTAKIFATTNNYPECKASEAFKDRVVAIPFDAEFTDSAPQTTSEQVESSTYMKDVYVVEQSFRGCFFMLYFHLRKFMSLEDGLLHYRQEPEYVLEFTNDYLIHADIYVQFKLFMDVQLMTGTMTTTNDVKSAVRQYLKTTKNTSYHESDLFISFEKEFGHLRRTDIHLGGGGESFKYTSFLDEDGEPPNKIAKTETNESMLVFYEGLVIKNLKRSNFDN